MGQSRDDFNTECRRCHKPHETIGHTLGECTLTKSKRIRRHDEVKELMAEKLSSKEGNVVYVEQSFEANGEILRPDLVVMTNESKAYVLDVTIRLENGQYLAQAAAEKTSKYRRIAENVRAITKSQTIEVIPVVLGSRGAVPYKTMHGLESLGFTKSDVVTMSIIALRSSIEIMNAFMDYGAREAPPLL